MVEVEEVGGVVVVHAGECDTERAGTQRAYRKAGSSPVPYARKQGGFVREWVLFGHVLSAIIWMGGSVYVEALTANVRRRSDRIALGATFRDIAALNQRLFTIAGVLVVVFGFWLVFITTWSFEMLWVAVSILLVTVSVTMDLFYTAPRSNQALEVIDDKGPADPDAAVLIDQVITAGHIRLGILLGVLFLMIFKPQL